MYQGEKGIVERIRDLKRGLEYDICSWCESKCFPSDDFFARAKDTQDFIHVVNTLIEKAVIVPLHRQGKRQEGLYLVSNKNEIMHIGYKEKKGYLLDSDLVYSEAMKITPEHYGFYLKSKRLYFWDLLCDRIIKLHWRCYVLNKGKKIHCIFVPNRSLFYWTSPQSEYSKGYTGYKG